MFASSIQSCCGEGGALQADVAVCGEHSPCSGQAASSSGALSPGAARPSPPRRVARVARGLRAFSPGAACLLPLQRVAWAARGLCAPCPRRGVPFPFVASGPGSQRFGALSPGAVRLFPPWRAAREARGLAPSPRARRAFSLRGPSGSGLRKSLDRNRGLFAGWEGAASLGLSLPLSPPPASYLQRGWAGSSLEFLSPFVLRTAGGVFRAS